MVSLVVTIASTFVLSAAPSSKTAMVPDDVKQAVKARVDFGYSPSIVVGVINEHGSQVFAYGQLRRGSGSQADGDTIYEIGSITKAFTGILLADMVQRSKVALDDPISKYLPADIDAPVFDGKEITLRQLSNHSSGLPRLPGNMVPDDSDNPYVSYKPADLYEFVDGYVPESKIGEKYAYSNLGAGLLGHLLERASKTTYEQLVWQRIAKPLGMSSTTASVTIDAKSRTAQGYHGVVEAPHWDIPTLAGAGDLISSTNDMLAFVAANLGLKTSPVYEAMKISHAPTLDTDIPNMQVGLGWHIQDHKGRKLIWHNGGTGGFRSFIGFAPDKKFGVVVLTNTSIPGVDDIGFHVLEPELVLETRWDKPTVKVDRKTLDSYAGYYEISPGSMLHVKPLGDMLTVQGAGQPVLTMYAKSDTEFFLIDVEAKGKFVADDNGKITHLVWTQGGVEKKAARKDGYTPPPPTKEIEVDAAILKRYVGKYEMLPGILFDVTLKEDQLYVKLADQPSIPVFAESETKFFYKVVTASITFHVEEGGVESGKATALTLHQGGQDQRARRLDDKK